MMMSDKVEVTQVASMEFLRLEVRLNVVASPYFPLVYIIHNQV